VLFNSLGYLIFLPIVVLLFWSCPQRWRVPLLLVASYVFYMTWKPVYGLLILGLTLVNYLFGLAIARANSKRKLWLCTAVTTNLIILGVFKYAYFTVDMLNQTLAPWGKHLPALPFQIILPLGISFFVFEFIHYVTDVYKGGPVVKSFPSFALFASFFPTQIAGPIKRYQDFIPQLSEKLKFNPEWFDQGVNLILFGLFKKVLFADNLAVVVQSAFDHPELLSSLDMWLAVYAFAFQIYFDFSGYTDIARGSALLIGFKVPPNFNLPYLASSIAEFWHRWHISLSTWLRDYLFIPLGGSRGGRLFVYRNLFLTMLLGGLWHGASMHFLVWGAYQGILLILHREFQRLTDGVSWIKSSLKSPIGHVMSIVTTFHLVCIGWVFFRADTFAQSTAIISKLLCLGPMSQGMQTWSLSLPSTKDPVMFMLLPFILALLFAGQVLSNKLSKRERPLSFPKALQAAYVAAMIALLIVFTPDTSPRFIYFQF
jgi:D-alanyl-lipoteichoic acid acyltransferase DltB (MBOAT superfamily)